MAVPPQGAPHIRKSNGVERNEDDRAYTLQPEPDCPHLHSGAGSADHRRCWIAERHHYHRRKTTSAAADAVRRGYGGVIKEKASESTPWWPPRVVLPKGAPNVFLIMTDDVGFGAPSTFGGVIPTPNMDRIARDGLRYTDFRSTSLCSPTRAALITGRNHHSVGNGVVGEISTGYPGYDSIIPLDKDTIGTILKANGYATSWFGKDHNTPSFQSSQAGPFNQWPNGMGFEYFYGFVGGDTNQWQPNLFRNTTAIYHLPGLRR
jgi:hypothetical protein